MKTKRIVILAKSAKNNNFCVAGLANTGEWIRPISTDKNIQDAVSAEAITFPNNTELQILDVVEVPLLKNISSNNFVQPENVYYDDKFFWKRVDHITLNKIIKWRGYDHRDKIFYSYDRAVEENFIRRQKNRESLLLLPITNLFIEVATKKDSRQFFAHFNYNGRDYTKFSVGDIEVRKNFENHSNGEYFFKDKSDVVFSLTNPYKDNFCYKMLAQIF